MLPLNNTKFDLKQQLRTKSIAELDTHNITLIQQYLLQHTHNLIDITSELLVQQLTAYNKRADYINKIVNKSFDQYTIECTKYDKLLHEQINQLNDKQSNNNDIQLKEVLNKLYTV